MITIWGRPSAYNFQKVHWFLEELGVEYNHINIGGSLGGLDSEDFLAMNPNGQIPVIEDNGNVIWESNTILRYLAANYGARKFWSDVPIERSIFERWMDWELANLQPSFLLLFWTYYRTPVNQRNRQIIKQHKDRCERYVGILDTCLGKNKYLSNNVFGLGDICVGTCFYRYFNMGLKVSRPTNVNEWYGRLSEREAYKKIIQVPFNALKGRLEA